MVEIVPILDADWPGAWRIIQDVSRQSHSFTYPKDVSETLARQIWVQPAPSHCVVARDSNGGVLGTAKMGPNQMGPGNHVATASFMVANDARGQGVGRALGIYAIDWAVQAGFRSMQFNAVVETNESAIALWKSLGFEIVGTVPKAFNHPERGYVGLYVMHLFLPADRL